MSGDTSSKSPELSARLVKLDQDVQKVESLRKRRVFVVRLGLLAILACIALFAFNLYTLVKNYDKAALTEHLEKQVWGIVESAEARQLLSVVRDELVPEFKKKLMAKIQADMPKFEKEAGDAAQRIQSHLNVEVRKKLEKVVDSSLEDIKKSMLEAHKEFDINKMDDVFKRAENVFVEKLEPALQKHWEAVANDLVYLNESMQKLGTKEEIAQIESMPAVELENAIVEAMLDLAIYHINPERGEKLSGGGGK